MNALSKLISIINVAFMNILKKLTKQKNTVAELVPSM